MYCDLLWTVIVLPLSALFIMISLLLASSLTLSVISCVLSDESSEIFCFISPSIPSKFWYLVGLLL